MKKAYCTPEMELLCFVGDKALAQSFWGTYSSQTFNSGASIPDVEATFDPNPEDGAPY